MKTLLENIRTVDDLRKLSIQQLPELAYELRDFILDTLSVKPGHLGASLGVVELSIALHYHYQTPEDLLIWDVGHQSYPHKILTGRKENFYTLRQKQGIAGFPVRTESMFDPFGVGHSSTSLSAIIGMATADNLHHRNRKHIAVIGDASIASGMALEAMNHLGDTDLDVLIILNDNSIGIDPSVGALKSHFAQLDQQRPNIFENLNLHYLGSFDGHSFDDLFYAFSLADNTNGPKIIHLKTTKGKGYKNAEEDQVKWHSPGKFNKTTGEIHSHAAQTTYQTVFAETMQTLMEHNTDLVAITPAMLTGSNLIELKKKFPQRVFDVGIAEQHALTFAAGLATQNCLPYMAIYSTFLQRAYDQLIHDIALQNLPVVLCIDRAGFVGTDGATHHGYFDLSFLNSIPNTIVATASNVKDFIDVLYTAQFTQQPFAIRFAKEEISYYQEKRHPEKLIIGEAKVRTKGTEIAICACGKIADRIRKIIHRHQLETKVTLIDFVFIKPINDNIFSDLMNFRTVLTFEDGILNGGMGHTILENLIALDFDGKIENFGYPDAFIEHATIDELNELVGLDDTNIEKIIFENLNF
ncbi:1-deoxy-D-xylulose-5-phosphate synthase [uncultured Weeksella sp.]|uniref:1-deoxy-D-xylulose-5-phosphate synthase n=1 Tax=uncultured Weeksella sp. TaxID=1161389 RepID=UPI00259B2968|nr:1-deoxy-D-xylulose-5-phosphate synthase [uncultured Weeksella sp.]